MDVVLGVSTTPTAVRMVVVEGHKADGAVIEHDTFDIVSTEASAADQVIDALMGTREGAFAGGHHVVCTGIMCGDRAQGEQLRSALADRGVDGVVVVSQLQAAAALAHAAGSLAGYGKTAVLVVTEEMATVSVIDTADASIIAVDTRPVAQGQARAVLTDMLTALRGHCSEPDGIVVVGSDRDAAIAQQLALDVLSIPASARGDGPLALARGAALAAARIVEGDLSTMALAYSQVSDAAMADTELSAVDELDSAGSSSSGKPFLLAGSALATIFTVGVLTLVISLAVSIRPTVATRPGAGFNAAPPIAAAPAPSAVPNALPSVPQPAAAPPLPAAVPPAPPPQAPPAPPAEAPVLASKPEPAQVPVAPPKAAAVPAPVVAAPPPDPIPAAAPPAPAAPPPAPAADPAPPPAAVPDNPPTGYVPGAGPPRGYAPGYGPQPAYGPGPGYGPQPAYGPGPGYGPQPAYGPGPGYGPQPAYGPGPGYGPMYQRPAPPRIPIIPGILSIGPGPGRFGSGPAPWMWPSG
jgi:hypothetical protein